MEDGHGMDGVAFHTCAPDLVEGTCDVAALLGVDVGVGTHRGRKEVGGSSWDVQDNAHKGMVRYLEASLLHVQHWGKGLPGMPPQSLLAACMRKGEGA